MVADAAAATVIDVPATVAPVIDVPALAATVIDVPELAATVIDVNSQMTVLCSIFLQIILNQKLNRLTPPILWTVSPMARLHVSQTFYRDLVHRSQPLILLSPPGSDYQIAIFPDR